MDFHYFCFMWQVGSIIAAVTIASGDKTQILLPFWIAGAGIIASMFGYFAVGCKDGAGQKELMFALHKGVIVASILVIGFSALIVAFTFEGREKEGWEIFGCILIGLVAGILSKYMFYFVGIFRLTVRHCLQKKFILCIPQLDKLPNISRRTLTGLPSLSPRLVSPDQQLSLFKVSVLV